MFGLQLSFGWQKKFTLNFINHAKPSAKRSNYKKIQFSDKFLNEIWCNLKNTYFPNNKLLDEYKVIWSTKPQKRTLASCNLTKKRVIVARELNYPEHYIWLEPLIYHEMCHSVVGAIKKGSRNSYHGKEFKKLEQIHPLMKNFDHWVKSGGWLTAIRSDRAKRAHQKRIK